MSEANTGAINPETGSAGNPQTGAHLEHAPQDAHLRLDRKDERNHGTTIEDAKRAEQLEKEAEEEAEKVKPTDLAKSHGNEPSRGAKVDEKIEDEEEALIRKMDEAKKQAEEAKKGKHH